MSTPDDGSSSSPDEAMMAVVENLQPIYAAAEGQRKQLEERGWSAWASERIAVEFACGMIRSIFAPRG